MVQFSITTPSLGFSASAMTSALAQFDAQVAQATSSVNAVVGASWTGSAADAFLADWNDFLLSATATREALASVAMRLQTAQSAYESTESQLVAASRSSRVAAQGPGVSAAQDDADERPLDAQVADLAHEASGPLEGVQLATAFEHLEGIEDMLDEQGEGTSA